MQRATGGNKDYRTSVPLSDARFDKLLVSVLVRKRRDYPFKTLLILKMMMGTTAAGIIMMNLFL